MDTPSTRLAGLAYLAIIVLGISSEVLLRGPLIDSSSAEATRTALLANEWPFKLSMAADMVMALCDAAVAVLLFRLFRAVAPDLALGAMVMRLMQGTVIALSLLFLQFGWILASESPDQADLALQMLSLHAYGYDLGLIFFAVNCALTGMLFIKARFAPSALGILLAASGLVYLIGSTLRFAAPDLSEAFAPAYLVPLISETAVCLWLLGLRFQRRAGAVAA